MVPRLAPVLVASLALIVVAACSGTAAAHPTAPVGPRSTSQPPAPTPVPTPVVAPTPTPSHNAGDVVAGPGPELSIEFPREDLLQVSLVDPAAKAWRLVVSGVGELASDRWEIIVETGDVGPQITATEIQQGEVVGEMDLSGYLDGTAAAGGCHKTLGVCLDSSGFRLPTDGDGTFAVRLQVLGAGTPILITGGTAGWPSEPFVLGPWTDTDAFPWGQG